MRISDWSSDVCSSDLLHKPDRFAIALGLAHAEIVLQAAGRIVALFMANHHDAALTQPGEAAEDCLIVAESAITRKRSEERRVGKECVSTCRSRWSPSQ